MINTTDKLATTHCAAHYVPVLLRGGRCGKCDAEVRNCDRKERVSKIRRTQSARRYASQRQRTPAWANKRAIRAIYQGRPLGHDVDHIYPLNGRLVSGLHVAENLQYLSRRSNSQKRNSLPQDLNTIGDRYP